MDGESDPPVEDSSGDTRLEILEGAREIQKRVSSNCPDEDLVRIAADVVGAAELATDRVKRLGSLFGLRALRIYVLLVTALTLGWWIYGNYLAPNVVRVASTEGESERLLEMTTRNGIDDIQFVSSRGSPDNLGRVLRGEADIAIVQAGVEIPEHLVILGVARQEYVLFFQRAEIPQTGAQPRVITFGARQGSHLLAERFFGFWGHLDVEWLHHWGHLADPSYVVPNGVHAAFVVIDPADSNMRTAIRKLSAAGFSLRDPDIGVHASLLPYLERVPVRAGYFHFADPRIPDHASSTYIVDNYVVARPSLTDYQRIVTARAFELEIPGEDDAILHSRGASIINDLATAIGATVNVFVILAAIFGVEFLFHRGYLHELNSLISRLSLMQSKHDVVGIRDRDTLNHERAH